MKRVTNSLLIFAAIIPLVLLFWPFAEWNRAMSVILRVVPSVAIQVLLCRICKRNIVKVIPALLTGAFAAWWVYLFFTSPHWGNATVGGLIADYITPFALIACLVIKKKRRV